MKVPFSLLRSLAFNVLLIGSSLAVIAVAIHAAPAFAQRGPSQRVVQGKVVDKANAGVNGAVVYLKDEHSLAVKSYIADDEGGYRFSQLAQNTDYELWAEANGKKSPVKTISSFDNKSQFTINLKIDK